MNRTDGAGRWADGRRARGHPLHAALSEGGASPVRGIFGRTGDGGIARDVARHRRESGPRQRLRSKRLGLTRVHETGRDLRNHTRQRKAETSANRRLAVSWLMSIASIWRGLEVRIAE